MIAALIAVGLLLGWGCAVAMCVAGVGMATSQATYTDLSDRVFGVFIAVFGVGLVLLAFMATTDAIGKTHYFKGQDDPCVEIHTTGKTTWTETHKGWYSYGGRYVWCGPGNLPQAPR